jgi:hypothetical protein
MDTVTPPFLGDGLIISQDTSPVKVFPRKIYKNFKKITAPDTKAVILWFF